MPSTTQKANIGDLMMSEYHESYNFEALFLAAAVTVPVNAEVLGYPVVVSGTTATIQTAAQVTAFTAASSCNVIADDTPAVAAFSAVASTVKYRVLRRGPAIVHRSGLRTADPAAANYDMTKFIAALLVAGIVVVNETGLTATIS